MPEQSLKEPDEPWTWDQLFASVSSQMQAEWFPVGGGGGGGTEEAGAAAEVQERSERPYTAFNRFPV